MSEGSLTIGDRFTCLCAWLLLPVVSLILRQRGFRRTERLLSGLRVSRTSLADPEAELQRARRTGELVSLAVDARRRPVSSLDQAMTLWWMLGLLGIHTSMRVGIYEQGGEAQAHAWVLLRDQVLIGETGAMDASPIVDVRFDRS